MVIVIAAASFGVGYAAGNNGRSTETLTSTSTLTSQQMVISTSTTTVQLVPSSEVTASDLNSSLGIDLILALNSTTIKQGQDLPNIIEVLNTLPRVNNVSVGSDLLVKPFSPKCDPGDSTPIDVEMYSGYHDAANISSASPLPYQRLCPAIFSSSLVSEEYYLFEPGSANSTLYGLTEAGKPVNSGPMSLRLVNDTSLYQFTSSFPRNVFPVGVYTLMVQDFWGQMVILHFSIVS